MKRTVMRWLASAGICFSLTFLFSSAALPFGLSPFSLGAYTSMFALGESYLPLTAAYLLARFLATGEMNALLQSVFAATGLGFFALLPKVTRRKIHPFYAVISAFFTQLFTLFFLPTSRYLLFFANLSLSTLFALLLLRPAMRRGKGFPGVDGWERAVFLLLTFAFGAGSYGMNLYGVTPYYLFLALLLPLSLGWGTVGSPFPFAFVLGAIASGGSLALLSPVAMGWIFSELLKDNRRVAAFALPISEVICFLLSGELFSPLNFPLLLSGALLVAFLPERFLPFRGIKGEGENRGAARAIVNKARLDLSGKLGYIGEALRKMSDSLTLLGGKEELEETARRLSEQFSRAMCENYTVDFNKAPQWGKTRQENKTCPI